VTTGSVGENGAEARDPAPSGIRERLAQAAFLQFSALGFDTTTVDQIADAAGVSRRTFFRYFRTKEDAIFPEHDRLRATVAADLQRRRTEPPLSAVCESVALVLNDYVQHRDVSLLRFTLTRTVTSLRDREVTAVHRYQRLFVRHLREHSPDLDDHSVEIMAAAVVAAHNSVLRDWLLNGAHGDPLAALHSVLDRVQALFTDSGGVPIHSADTTVAVFTTATPIADVISAIKKQQG
jgi:AcrR family transcriptional regulator